MQKIPFETANFFEWNIKELEQAESAIEQAWDELEIETAEIIAELTKTGANTQQISDRFAAAKQLRSSLNTHKKQLASRQWLQLDNSPVAFIEWDSEFRVTGWSPIAEQIFGWKSTETIGKNWQELLLIDETQCELVKSIINQLLNGSETRNICQNRNYTKDGSLVYCEWCTFVLKDSSENIISIQSFARDIGHTHRIQKEQYRCEQAFTNLAENSTDLIARFDQRLCYVYANKAIEAVTGKLRGEFQNKTNQQSGMPPHFCNLCDRAFGQVFRTSKPETIEFEFPTSQGIQYYHCRVIPEFASDKSVETILVIARDITEIKQVEARLRENEAKFRRVVDSNIIGIMYWDLSGNITDANDAFLSMVKYSRDDLALGKLNWQNITPTEYRNQDAEKIAELAATGKISPCEKEYIRSDGSLVSVLLGAAFYEGSQHFGVSFVLDLSERKQAEIELQKNQQLLESIVKTLPNFLYIYDAVENKNIYANASVTAMLGYTPEELQVLDVDAAASLIHPEDMSNLITGREQLKHSNNSHAILDIDYRIQHKNGEWRWVHDRSTIFKRTADGQILQIIGSVLDISDRKTAEAELKKLNETLEAQVAQRTAELETFFDTLPDRIFVVERENMRQGFVNKSVAQLTGFNNRQEMEGKTLFEIFPAELAQRFFEENLQVFETGETLHFQESFPIGGKNSYFDTFKIPLRNLDGEVYALIGTSREITELVETKQALSERTEQLEAANQELESFSYSVSHDLRAPLRHISGFVNALRQRLRATEAVKDSKIVHYLEVIEDSSEKMSLLIDGLLMLSRVSRTELMQIPIDLNHLVQTAIKLAKLQTDTTSVPISVDVEFEIGDLPSVTGDPTLLQQVLSNLIDNAVKFSQGSTPPKIIIDALPDGTVFVKDNGVGFSMASVDRLFGAFQRLHSQKEFEGTGIGLAIAGRIVRRHGGRIWAIGAPGQGATFYFKLGSNNPNP